MLKRRIVLPPEHLYPADEWRIVEARYSDEFVGLTETVFSLGNGFVGVRGSFEEGRPALVPGTFVNGFHETWPIVHAEGAPALAKTGQTIVNVPDTTIIKLYVDDEPFFLPAARLQEYRRILDMRAGTLTRELVWATAAGKHVRVRSRRMVSLEHRHLVAMTYEVTMLDQPAPVVVSSLVLNRQDARQAGHLPEYRPGDPRLATVLPQRVLNVRAAELAGQRILLGYQTTSSGMTLGVGIDHVIDAACSSQAVRSLDDETGEVLLTADAVPGVPIRITKYATYQSSRSIPVPELVEFMEENTGLSESLIFEVGQPGILALNADELGALDTLGALGYGFSLDHVGDLDVDFASLRDRSFRYVKIEAKTLLHDMAEARASIPAADMTSYLDRFDLKLIVEKVDDEASLERLMDYGVDLAEGDLFARPRPVTPEMFRELAEADAA